MHILPTIREIAILGDQNWSEPTLGYIPHSNLSNIYHYKPFRKFSKISKFHAYFTYNS